MATQPRRDDDPRPHYRKVRGMLEDVVEHVRGDVGKTDDPKAEALFETTAEVLLGLAKVYEHAENRSEAAWR